MACWCVKNSTQPRNPAEDATGCTGRLELVTKIRILVRGSFTLKFYVVWALSVLISLAPRTFRDLSRLSCDTWIIPNIFKQEFMELCNSNNNKNKNNFIRLKSPFNFNNLIWIKVYWTTKTYIGTFFWDLCSILNIKIYKTKKKIVKSTLAAITVFVNFNKVHEYLSL